MSKSLNVVALISGGKDSLYTLLHCIQNGHKVVALANLYPSLPDGANPAAIENEDINSFMYQTVGHNVIPLYAEALQLPLYRQRIMGTSKQTGRYYDPSLNASSADETEDLLPLLENVKIHHPEVNAVCSGAILSTYQRTRIESVAVRLALTSLAYLWQYPFLPPPSSRQDSLTGLLEDMSAAGCDSRIIKVASGGMPAGLLGANVADARTMKRILANMAPYFENDEPALRGAVLGEGGEFETLALDGPRLVWKKKIEFTEEDSSVVSEEGGVHWLKLDQARTVQHNAQAEHNTSTDNVHVPNTFDPQFEYIAAMHSRAPDNVANASQSLNEISAGTTLLNNPFEVTPIKSFESHTLSIVNIAAPNVLGNAVQQMEHIVSCLENVLHRISIANNIKPPLSSASIISTTLLIKSMTSFLAVNNSYARLFPYGLPNPPARVTIACDLPLNVLVSLSCIISLLPRSTHRGLHVQSRSYWAPANIGPYSQAVCVPFTSDDKDPREFVYVAGQIPLMSASMEILQAPFVDQALLALQHLWRIGQERGVDLWTWGVAFLPRLDEVESGQMHLLTAKIWRQAHQTTVYGKSALDYVEDGDEDSGSGPDAWDLKMGTGRVTPSVGKHRHVLPNSTVFANELDRLWIPPIVVAEVKELPRAAPIEWHSHGLGGLPKRPSGTPEVFVGFWELPWGTVSVCSYQHTSKLSDRDIFDDEEDQPIIQEERRDHHFVTIQVLQAQTGEERTKVPSISEVLEYVLPARSGLPSDIKADSEEKVCLATRIGDGRFTYVHGAAYIAGYHGEAAFADLGRLESIPGITLVPCRRLWGRCYRTRVSGLHDEEEEDMGLSMALTVRVDTIADRGLNSSEIR